MEKRKGKAGRGFIINLHQFGLSGRKGREWDRRVFLEGKC